MEYQVYHIQCERSLADIILAFLAELPFDTFQDSPEGFDAFIPSHLDTDDIFQTLADLQSNFPFQFEKKTVATQNWNKVWESNFKTVQVGNFCGVRADFHPPFEDVQYEIIINPKMAFGTGHHATTHMMMDFMQDIDFRNKSVFDYGCGTGILAILAAQMGSDDIDAVDIELPAYTNTLENIRTNNTPGINCYHGTLTDVPMRTYDIILANINRNVILDSFSSLHQRLKPGGILLSSGYLLEDKELMDNTHLDKGFLPDSSKNQGKWIATKAYRRYD